jgi:hypothetical protein
MGAPANTSRRLQPKTAHMKMFDLREVARSHTPEAIAVIAAAMKDKDPKVRLLAASIICDRAYGKPDIHAEINTTHSFCVAPQVMPIDEWLLTRGQGRMPDGSIPPLPKDAATTTPRHHLLDLAVEPDPDKKPN